MGTFEVTSRNASYGNVSYDEEIQTEVEKTHEEIKYHMK